MNILGAVSRPGDRLATAFRRIMIAAALTLAGAKAWAGPPFATDDPESLPYRHGEAYLFTAGSRTAGGTGIDAGPGVELNYSFFPDTFAHLVVPVTRSIPSGGPSTSGLGDVELGFKWQVTHQAVGLPDIGVFPLVILPTGDKDRGLGSGHTRFYLPLWLQKDWGSWSSYGGGGYWVNPGAGNRNWWFTGILLQHQISDALLLGGEIYHTTPDTVGGHSNTAFSFGGGYALGGPYQVLFSLGRNLNHIDDNRLSWYLGLYRTF